MRHALELAAARTVRAIVRWLPRALVRPCGTLLGYTFYAVDRVHRRVADTNLRTAFPQRTRSERETIT
jgi:lauroyl/myristoyl acyltransferase